MVEEFLAAYAVKRWVWGEVDCCLILADWIVANGHPDPAERLRRTYGGQLSCARLVRRAGGLVALIDRESARFGLERARMPEAGVVAVVGDVNRTWRQWGAIHDGKRWCIRLHHGIERVAAAPLTMWRV